jgi:hypothetical protein
LAQGSSKSLIDTTIAHVHISRSALTFNHA